MSVTVELLKKIPAPPWAPKWQEVAEVYRVTRTRRFRDPDVLVVWRGANAFYEAETGREAPWWVFAAIANCWEKSAAEKAERERRAWYAKVAS